jgi:hypothetical protein
MKKPKITQAAETGAPEKEIEITPEMIAAGRMELFMHWDIAASAECIRAVCSAVERERLRAFGKTK